MIHLATSLVIITFIFASCSPNDKAPQDPTDLPTEQDNTEVIKPTTPANMLYLQIMSIEPDMPIGSIDMSISKGMLQTGEGEFEVYYIKSEENKEVGFIMPNYENEELVGDVFISSPDFVLPNGLRIGSTWKDIKEAVGEVEVHGSEIESRTYADLGQFNLRLDVYHTEYDVDESQIPDNTEVLGIWIRKTKAGN